MNRLDTILVAAGSLPRQNFCSIFVDGCDKIRGEMPMPDDALTDDLHAASATRLAVLWGFTRLRRLKPHPTPLADDIHSPSLSFLGRLGIEPDSCHVRTSGQGQPAQ
jgi:hypothetical protein